MLSGLPTCIVISEDDAIKLTGNGFYKTPRIIKGLAFLEHIHDTLDCGNEMYVQFLTNEDAVRVTSYTRLYDSTNDNAVVFNTPDRAWKGDILVADITEFEFIQYRPQTAWKAIHMGSTKRFNLEQFDELWLDQTFQKLHPVIVNHDGKFWHVMGLKLDVDADGSFWGLYLKRQDSDSMKEIRMPLTQKFIYNPISGSWSLDDPTQEIKDLEETLRADAILDVTVSGVPMKLIRVQEIAKGVLFFVFQDEEKNKRYYYNRPAIKLRIVTDSETGEQKYLLDHIKAMHID